MFSWINRLTYFSLGFCFELRALSTEQMNFKFWTYAICPAIFHFQLSISKDTIKLSWTKSVDCCPLTFFWAFRLSPSGFPLYLFPLTLQKDAAPIPNALAAAEKTKSVQISEIRGRKDNFPLITQMNTDNM